MDRSSLKRWRPLLVGLFSLGLAAVALKAALHGLEWNSFQAQLRQLDPRWLAVAVVFDVLSYAAQGLRWRCLLDGATFWQTTRAIYAGLFLNEIVPLRPGEAVRAWLAARDLRVGILKVAPTMLTERLMDGLWLAVALQAALVLAPIPESLLRIAWSVIGAVGILLLLSVLLGGRTRFAWLAEVRAGLRNCPALAVSALFLVVQGLAFWAVTRASHLSLGISAAFVVMLVVRLGTMIPGAPANLGTHQFSTVLGLSLYGVPQSAAAGFSLVVFVVLTAPLLAIGFAACLSAGLNWQNVRAVAHPTNLEVEPLAP